MYQTQNIRVRYLRTRPALCGHEDRLSVSTVVSCKIRALSNLSLFHYTNISNI